MRFLFVTIQGFESDFYGRVGAELGRRGHEVEHLTVSRRATRRLHERGRSARALPELVEGLAPYDLDAEVERIVERYDLPSIRELYWSDPASSGRAEEWCVRRTVEHVLAVERLLDDVRPDVLVPEVGLELVRTVAHTVALDRGVRTFFLFYTIFPNPLRLYVDSMQGPIVPPEELRELAPEEREEVDRFRAEFTARAEPIRARRRLGVTRRRLHRLRAYGRARVGEDRDNEYLHPGAWLLDALLEPPRRAAAHAFYSRPDPGRRFVYFPIHVADDYKIKRLIPHCVDQPSLVAQVADALPPGCDLVLKEHPMSIGRNGPQFLRRLTQRPNVRLVAPSVGSHELIRNAEAVAVISSTVGLEALLYAKPVLTLGRPFYAGYGVTVDVDSFAGIRDAVATVLRFRPDPERIERFLHAAMRRCYPGVPVLVDSSDENARTLAGTLDRAAAEVAAREVGGVASPR